MSMGRAQIASGPLLIAFVHSYVDIYGRRWDKVVYNGDVVGDSGIL